MLPIEPGNLVVLTVCVVVPALRPRDLVAARDHRDTLRQEQRSEEIPSLPRPAFENSRIVGRPFRAAVPRTVVTLAVAVLLPVRLVVLLVVRDDIVHRQPVLQGHEVHARIPPPSVVLVETGAARTAVGQRAQ